MKKVNNDHKGIFFGNSKREAISSEEYERRNAPNQIAKEIASLFYGWAQEARSRIPSELQWWAGEHPEKPDWLDLNSLGNCWHLIALVGNSLPVCKASKVATLDDEQLDAVEVLYRCRRVYDATAPFSENKAQAITLFSAVLDLGIKLSEATTRPYEKEAFKGYKSTTKLNAYNKGTPEGSINHIKRKESMEIKERVSKIAHEYFTSHSDSSNSDIARFIKLKHPDLEWAEQTIRVYLSKIRRKS